MKKRWLIRSLALTLLTLCVVAWVGSYWREFTVIRQCKGYSVTFTAEYASICLDYADGQFMSIPWLFYQKRAESVPYEGAYSMRKFPFVGFGYFSNPGRDVFVWVPLWFPAILAAVFLWFTWRKTKPKVSSFPIEPTAKPE